MAHIFCCSSIRPYRPQKLDHEAKFNAFMRWAEFQTSQAPTGGSALASSALYAVQLVRQINFGSQESIRYFIPGVTGSECIELAEDDLLKWNFEKVNSYAKIARNCESETVMAAK